MTLTNKIRERIAMDKDWNRSAWGRGVTAYALELLDEYEDQKNWHEKNDKKPFDLTKENMLNGAKDWSAYSWGGCSLVYDGDIAERLCTASELKKTRNGERKPNSNEEWLDCQARALHQAAARILQIKNYI